MREITSCLRSSNSSSLIQNSIQTLKSKEIKAILSESFKLKKPSKKRKKSVFTKENEKRDEYCGLCVGYEICSYYNQEDLTGLHYRNGVFHFLNMHRTEYGDFVRFPFFFFFRARFCSFSISPSII